MTHSIKDVCKTLNMTVHTVRHYLDNGLVPNLSRDEHGNRIFDHTSLNWLKAAAFICAGGMSIVEIRHYFDL